MKRFLHDIWHLLCIHLLGLTVLTFFRLGLFAVGHGMMAESSMGNYVLQSTAFVRGVWFDNVIACYILIIPLLFVVVCNVIGDVCKHRLRYASWWMFILYGLTFAVSAANIPYFLYFFKNINSSIWNWVEYGTTTLGMLLGDFSYCAFIACFVVALCAFAWLMPRAGTLAVSKMTWGERGYTFFLGVACIAMCLFGIRGRRGYNPIKVSAAYYCQDPFLNQLGINPAFNLLTTTLDDRRPENRELHLMDTFEASKRVATHLGRSFSYITEGDKSCLRKGTNVVLLLMESMSYDLLHRGETPFLDSLMNKSISFSHCYSAGNHTNHGIFSTLYSYPALMFRNLMKGSNIPHYEGLPSVLKANGYHTLFFMTHEAQYDNMNAFLRTNGFDEIYSQENYPREKVVNSFGVQDDYLYSFALDKLNTMDQPFMATLLSISNHPPYVIPKWFTPKSSNKEEQIVEYADEALRRFFNEARRQSWYENTVFVLLGDHGKLIGSTESEMPECLNHIPLMYFSPQLQARNVENWTMQLDIQPTLLEMLGIQASQNNFGLDALHVQRPMAYYTADNVIGARTNGRLFIYEPSTQQQWLYVTLEDGRQQVVEQMDSTFKAMRDYLFCHLQSAQEEIKKHE